MSRPELSVVISTLGNHEGLRRVLDGYAAQTAPRDRFEVIVVADATEPDPAAVDAVIGERAFAVHRERGPIQGLSANRNAGARAAAAPIVLFTDNDTIPAPRLVAEHLAWHERHPEEEAVILGRVRWSPEVEVTTLMRWLDMGLQFSFAHLKRGEVPWACFAGANVSLKASFIRRVGAFEERRLPYLGEDTEFAYRAHGLGMRLLYNPRARVDHLRTMSFDMVARRVRRMAAVEYEISQIHPELEPWWHPAFASALERPPPRGRGLRLAPFVPLRTPWLGRRVWKGVDLAYRQALAPHYLEAWDEAVAGGSAAQPEISELLADSPSGSEPGGPK